VHVLGGVEEQAGLGSHGLEPHALQSLGDVVVLKKRPLRNARHALHHFGVQGGKVERPEVVGVWVKHYQLW